MQIAKRIIGAFISVVFFVAAVSGAGAGCAATLSDLPVILAYTQSAALVLDTITQVVQGYFNANPQAIDTQKKIDAALARTRTALALVDDLAKAGSAADQKQIDAAFVDAKAAYADLLALLAPLGVKTGAAAARGAAGGLVVPAPEDFVPRART